MGIKRIIIIFICLFAFTGCTIESISNNDVMKNVDIILNKKIKYSNKDAIGYQYYLPSNMNVKRVSDFNQEITSSGISYYLYADIVSYYYKVQNNYKRDKKAYISESLSYNGKKGYLEVNKEKNGYFVEMMYNYAKIEATVPKKELTNAISNMSYILTSIKYNKNIIETLVGDKKYDLSDNEVYNIFKTKKKDEGNFLDYINEYDNYEGEDIESLIEKEELQNEKDD